MFVTDSGRLTGTPEVIPPHRLSTTRARSRYLGSFTRSVLGETPLLLTDPINFWVVRSTYVCK